MSAELMKGLIANGTVKAGSGIENYNMWCAQKAKSLCSATLNIARQGQK